MEGDGFYLKAFGELHTCRGSVGMGLPDIPWDKIVKYGRHVGLDQAMIDPFTIVIRRMDSAYRKWHDAEAEKNAKAARKEKPIGSTKRG